MAIIHGGDLFAIARANGWDWRDVLDFSASINPLGPAPRVRSAICAAVDRVAHYPEREPARLRSALGRTLGVNESQIILGNGATELIFFIARIFSDAPACLALPAFSEFHRAFPSAGHVDLERPHTWPKEGLLVLTRPANPTGKSFAIPDLENHLRKTSGNTLVDESFLEFSGLPSAAALLAEFPRLILLRSLTKFYALPGLRIGALITSAGNVRLWRESREPWQVNVLAEEAALAALGDEEHTQRSFDFVRLERGWLHGRIAQLPGAEPEESDANFLYVKLAYPARLLVDHLQKERILVRNCAAWPGLHGEAIRVAVRRRIENQKLLEVWARFRPEAA